MFKNRPNWHKLRKPTIISAVILLGPLLWFLVELNERATLSSRLVSSVKEHSLHQEIFTESKIIEKQRYGPINLNGDGGISATFQLSKAEVTTLLSSDNLIKCPPHENCQIESLNFGPDCGGAIASNETMYELCVDTSSNQAEWSVMWY